MNEIATKEKILGSALPLFARHGFEGLSIRNIAKSAGVNIAAVNYHFQNKENLYYSVVVQSYRQISQQIVDLESQKNWKPDAFALAVWKGFLENGPLLVNTFRILISGSNVFGQLCSNQNFSGPPGEEAFIRVLKRETPRAPIKEVKKVAQLMICNLTHSAILLSSIPLHQESITLADYKGPSLDEMRGSIKLLVKMSLKHLESFR